MGAEYRQIELVLVFQSKQEKKRKEPYSAKEISQTPSSRKKKGRFLYYAVLFHDDRAGKDLSK